MGIMIVLIFKDKKIYVVNFKGLIVYLFDILFVDNVLCYYYVIEMLVYI